MIRGLYSAAAGMVAESLRHDVIANNLANAATPGFKRSETRFAELAEAAIAPSFGSQPVLVSYNPGSIGDMGFGSRPLATYHDWAQGSLRRTDNPLDVALDGAGFFVVGDRDNPFYTRAGNFALDAEGRLVTTGGVPVLDENGRPIQISGEGTPWIQPDGEVIVGEESMGTLARVQFANPDGLENVGGNLFRATNASGPATRSDVKVVVGSYEESNVSTVREMVDLIAAMRAYEAAQRAVSIQDQTLGKAVNELAGI